MTLWGSCLMMCSSLKSEGIMHFRSWVVWKLPGTGEVQGCWLWRRLCVVITMLSGWGTFRGTRGSGCWHLDLLKPQSSLPALPAPSSIAGTVGCTAQDDLKLALDFGKGLAVNLVRKTNISKPVLSKFSCCCSSSVAISCSVKFWRNLGSWPSRTEVQYFHSNCTRVRNLHSPFWNI